MSFHRDLCNTCHGFIASQYNAKSDTQRTGTRPAELRCRAIAAAADERKWLDPMGISSGCDEDSAAMWDQDELDGTSFRVSGWRLRVECTAAGVQLVMQHDSSREATGTISLVGGKLPAVADAFVRGDELHLAMPQNDGINAGLDLVLLVVEASRDYLVIESTLSIQTMWLDAHPMIEVQIPGKGELASYSQDSALVYSRQDTCGELRFDVPTVSVLVDERDRQSIDDSGKGAGTLRFFGEFMEKGVIRKVQPWWIWSNTGPDSARIRGLAADLAKRPLPLTS